MDSLHNINTWSKVLLKAQEKTNQLNRQRELKDDFTEEVLRVDIENWDGISLVFRVLEEYTGNINTDCPVRIIPVTEDSIMSTLEAIERVKEIETL